jgi:hypothetical protein
MEPEVPEPGEPVEEHAATGPAATDAVRTRKGRGLMIGSVFAGSTCRRKPHTRGAESGNQGTFGPVRDVNVDPRSFMTRRPRRPPRSPAAAQRADGGSYNICTALVER